MEYVDLKGFENYYMINKNGEIKSKDRVVVYVDGRNKHCKGKQMSTYKDKNGYAMVRLTVDKISRIYAIHRLLAFTFLEKPLDKNYINHKDENKSNNDLDNLEWVTNQENMLYSSRRGSNPTNKICLQFKDGILINEYSSIHEASRQTKLSPGNIHLVMNGIRNRTGGYEWKYKEGDE